MLGAQAQSVGGRLGYGQQRAHREHAHIDIDRRHDTSPLQSTCTPRDCGPQEGPHLGADPHELPMNPWPVRTQSWRIKLCALVEEQSSER